MDVVTLQAAKADAKKRYASRLRSAQKAAYEVNQVMTVPPAIGSLTTSTAISNAITWGVITNSGSVDTQSGSHFTYSCAGAPVPNGNSFPDVNYLRFSSLTNGTNPTAPYAVDFYFDGTTLELLFKQLTGQWRLWVDDQLALSGVTSVTQTGSLGFQPVTFATRAVRHIRFEGYGLPWGGVNTGPLDSIWRASVNGPRVICIGDSFTEGANMTAGPLGHWVRWFGETMGWRDVWSSGAGGTGYLNNSGISGRVTFINRLANDVYPFKPDLVIWMGGHNDISGYTPSALQAAALACYQGVQANLPNCVQIALGPVQSSGLKNQGSTQFLAAAAVKAAAAAAGIYYLDPHNAPLDNTPITTTVASTIGSGSASLGLNTVIPIGAILDLEGVERRRVIAVSGAGPYTHTLDYQVNNVHTTGAAVTQVGSSVWSGTGNTSSPQSDGNCDYYIGSDGIHPTAAGQEALGKWVAGHISKYLLAAA